MYRRLLRPLFSSVEGGAFSVIYWDGDRETYGGDPPRFTIRLRNKHVVPELFRDPILGFGEGYVNGHIDFEGDLADAFRLAHRNKRAVGRRTGRLLKELVRIRPRATSLKKQARDVQHHYDLGNEFYSLWLDETMTYSCAYFHDPTDSLTHAQTQKVDHTLRKLCPAPGQSLLDIGCGWGALVIRAAQEYGVRATGSR